VTAEEPPDAVPLPLPPAIGRPATAALTVTGRTDLRDVARLTERELLALHGVGPKAVRLLREAMAEHGLSLVP
jgi:hypothetical protein